MKTSAHADDPFREKIREILLATSPLNGGGDFKTIVFAEVQNYSMELQEAEHASDFFFRLCELIVDCQSLAIPDDSFRIVVAGLLLDPKDVTDLGEEVRLLAGMDPESFETAKEHFRNRQCIDSALGRERTGRKGSIMAGKRNFSRVEQTVS